MDSMSNQEELNPKKKNQKSSAYRVIKFFLIILLIPLGLAIRTFTSEFNTSQENINQIEEYAKQAIITTCSFEKDIPYQSYIENMCEISTVTYCEKQPDIIPEDRYSKFVSANVGCEILSSEYIEVHKSITETLYVYRVHFKIFSEDEKINIDHNQAVVMKDENGWKLYNMMDYEEYLEIVSAN